MISEDLGSVGLPLESNDPPGFKHTCSALHSTAGTLLDARDTGLMCFTTPLFPNWTEKWKKSSIFSSLNDGYLQGKSQKQRMGKGGEDHSGMSLAPQKWRGSHCVWSEVVGCAFPLPQRCFFTGMVLISVRIRLFHSLRRLSVDISAALPLIHDSEFSCTNTVDTHLKKKKGSG